MKRVLTQRKMARILGISQSAISKAIGDAPDISEKTKERVKSLAQKYSYTPNPIARELVLGYRPAIGVILYGLLNPYYPKILEPIFAASMHSGFYVIYFSWSEDERVRVKQLNFCLQQRVAGIITKPCERMGPAYFKKIPTVIIENNYSAFGIPSVLSDHRQGAEIAVDYLIEKGHRKIAHLSGGNGDELVELPSKERTKGYLLSLRRAGIRENCVEDGGSTVGTGVAGAQKLLQRYPDLTAIFCYNDHVAMGAMQVIWKSGRRVPEDVSLIGMGDDIQYPEYQRIALTTVRQPAEDIGREAVSLLLEMLHGGKVVKERILPCELVIRDSVAPLRR